MKRSKKEKRLHPRIKHSLPFRVAVNGYDFATTTMVISCVGAYCRIDKYVPPFTRVMVKFDLPVATEEESRNFQVECKGVIVRSEDEPAGGFNIAIFFNAIRDEQRRKISQYISQFLPKEPLSLAA